MKRFLICILSVALLSLAKPATAQSLNKRFSIGFGLEGGVPSGNSSNVYNYTGGMTLRFSLRAGHGFATVTAGGIAFVPQNLNGQNLKAGLQIPIKAGYKYIIIPHLFVMGELGYSTFRFYYEDQYNNLQMTNSGGFTYAPAVGFQWHALEISARYETIQLSAGNQSFMGFRLGFNF